jgi:hypothetical protein
MLTECAENSLMLFCFVLFKKVEQNPENASMMSGSEKSKVKTEVYYSVDVGLRSLILLV